MYTRIYICVCAGVFFIFFYFLGGNMGAGMGWVGNLLLIRGGGVPYIECVDVHRGHIDDISQTPVFRFRSINAQLPSLKCAGDPS